MTWSDLDDVARNVMIIASEEGAVWEACASWVPEPAHRGAAEIERTRKSVARLMQLGLVRMYHLSPGNPDLPDLTDAEVVSVMNDQRRWVFDQGGSHDVALYLTELGETVYHGAAAEEPTA